MSQHLISDLDIDPDVTSGTQLSEILDRMHDAFISGHSGAARPPYAQAGLLWADTDFDPPKLFFFNGVEDIEISGAFPGGTADQVLAKIDNQDGNYYWRTINDPGKVGVIWQVQQETDFIASAGMGYPLAAGCKMTLPLTPKQGDQVAWKDFNNDFDETPCYIDPNGNDIEQLGNAVMELNSRGQGGTLVWVTNRWLITDVTEISHVGGATEPGTFLEKGGINGGEILYGDTATFYVQPFRCLSEDGAVTLSINMQTMKFLPVVAPNTNYNIFAVRYEAGGDGIETTTDETGADLAGISHKRWLGFVRTNNLTEIIAFKMYGDVVRFLDYEKDQESLLIQAKPRPTSYEQIDLSSFVPVSRIESVRIVGRKSTENASSYISMDGVTDHYQLGSTPGSASAVSAGALCLFFHNWYLKASSTTFDWSDIYIYEANMNR